MFVPGLQPFAIPIAMASSMAITGLQGGHFDDAMQAGIISGISAGIGQGVAQGIALAGIGESFGRTVAAGAAAGFVSGGAGALLSGQSGAAAWKAAYQGAALSAATAGVLWGIQQSNPDVVAYREMVRSYRAAVKSLDISGYAQYAMFGEGRTQTIMDGGGDSWSPPTASEEALQPSWIGDLMIDTAAMGFAGALKATPGALFGTRWISKFK